jgi:hypothetical protein
MTARLGPARVRQILSVYRHSLDEGPKRHGSMNTHDADGGDGQKGRATIHARSLAPRRRAVFHTAKGTKMDVF